MDKNAKILIADDSEFMRKVLRGILVNEGFSMFVEAENGKDALAKYKIEKPDLVLLDIIMSEFTGLDFLREVDSAAKVLVISAVGQESMIEDAKKAGALGYIIKPFDNSKVIEEVTRVLGGQ